MRSIGEEFEDAWKDAPVPTGKEGSPRTMFLLGARWAMERAAQIAENTRAAEAADANTPIEIAEEIRTLASELGENK